MDTRKKTNIILEVILVPMMMRMFHCILTTMTSRLMMKMMSLYEIHVRFSNDENDEPI